MACPSLSVTLHLHPGHRGWTTTTSHVNPVISPKTNLTLANILGKAFLSGTISKTFILCLTKLGNFCPFTYNPCLGNLSKIGNRVVYSVWEGGNLFLLWIFTCVRQNIVCWWRSSKQPTCPYFPHTASYLDWYTWNISVIFSVVDKLNFYTQTAECKFNIIGNSSLYKDETFWNMSSKSPMKMWQTWLWSLEIMLIIN